MSISDTLFFQNRIQEITFRFAEEMLELRKEDPELAERIAHHQWSNQVWASKIALGKHIEKQIEVIERQLLAGDFVRKA